MSVINFFTRKRKTKIGTVELDATLKETHNRSSNVTSFEVEEGAPVSDHIKRDPITVSIEGIISGVPLSTITSLTGAGLSSVSASVAGAASAGLGIIAGTLLEESQERKLDALAALDSLWQLDTPFDIVTGLKLYESMAIQNITYTVDNKTGDSLFFSCALKEVRIVKEQSVAVTAKEKRVIEAAKKAKEKAKQEMKEAEGAKKNKATILKALFDKVAS